MKQRNGVEEESCFWFRRVTTADVTIYLSSDNYYCRRYIEATRSSTSYPPPLFLPRLTSSSVVSFFFFSFLFSSQLLASPTRWIMNPQDRWYNNFAAFLSCGVSCKQHAISQRILPFGARLYRSRGNIRCHGGKYQIGEVGKEGGKGGEIERF